MIELFQRRWKEVPTELHQKRSRASPKITQIRHTQDFFALLARGESLDPLEKFDPRSRQILEAIAHAIVHQSKTSDGKWYLAFKETHPWFKFSLITPEDEKITPRLQNFPRTGMPKNVAMVKCRKCGTETFFLMIALLQLSDTQIRPKMGYLSIECGKLVLDHLTFEDLGL